MKEKVLNKEKWNVKERAKQPERKR